MEEKPDVQWEGKSGRSYGYWIVPLDPKTKLINEPGNYILAKKTKSGIWDPIYIGQAEKLEDCIRQNLQQDCILRNEPSHIHAHPGPDEEKTRIQEQSDLVENWNPTCNE